MFGWVEFFEVYGVEKFFQTWPEIGVGLQNKSLYKVGEIDDARGIWAGE